MRVFDVTQDRSGNLTELADPGWSGLDRVTLPLAPVPLERQPNEYIRRTWSDRAYGTVREVEVAAAAQGDRLFVRLEWADSEIPNTEFLDGAGVFFPDPDDEESPEGIGSRAAPVRLWAWRDRMPVQQALPAARELLASGPGVFHPYPVTSSDGDEGVQAGGGSSSTGVAAMSARSDGRWAVVLSGELSAARSGRMGVVVWDGSNEERAGIGAVTQAWVPLVVDRGSQD